MEKEKEITKKDIETLHEFLQGKNPDGVFVKYPPRLSRSKAFSVIWFLQEVTGVLPDQYEMCDECNEIYDSWEEGVYTDPECYELADGKPLPGKYHSKHFCDSCRDHLPEFVCL